MAKTSKLSQEMIDNIKSYSEEITTLEDFVAGVRQNIGMYIGSKGNKGFINMTREILQNAIDEMMKKTKKWHFESMKLKTDLKNQLDNVVAEQPE